MMQQLTFNAVVESRFKDASYYYWLLASETLRAVWKSKFYGAFVLTRRVVLHAIDATPARWRGNVGSSPLDGASAATSSPRNDLVENYRVHSTHWLISTQVVIRSRG